MDEATDNRMSQLRRTIYEKANQLSRQITLAAEEAGRHAAEARAQAAIEGSEGGGWEAFQYANWSDSR